MNRILFYALYQEQGKIYEYVIMALREYCKIMDYVVVVSNHVLPPEEKKKISFVDEIYEREDVSFDVGAFSDALRIYYGWERLSAYDEVFFINDSLFGPFYSLTPMIDEMESRTDIDFWGLTARDISDFDGGCVIYPEHIQLYFYAVRRRMFESDDFKNYWENILSRFEDFRGAITEYEFGFTKYFAEKGFKWDVLYRAEGYYGGKPEYNLSPYHYNSFELVQSGKYPFLKRKLFSGEFVFGKYSDKTDLRRCFEYIKSMTTYNVDAIWEYIIENYEMEEIIRALCLYEIGEKCNELPEETFTDEIVLLTDIGTNEECQAVMEAKKMIVRENIDPNGINREGLISLFRNNPRLGVVVPPTAYFGKIANGIFDVESMCVRKEIAEYIRNTDVKSLSGIPRIAQEMGYYTSVYVGHDYVKFLLAGLYENRKELLGAIGIGNEPQIMDDYIREIKKEKLEAFLNNNEGKAVVFFGAGKKTCEYLSVAQAYADVRAILVTSIAGNPKLVEGVPVVAVDSIENDISKTVAIVTVNSKYRKEIAKKLELKGIKEIFYI